MPVLGVLVLLTPVSLTLVSVVTSTLGSFLWGDSAPSWSVSLLSGANTLLAMTALGVFLGALGGPDDSDAVSGEQSGRQSAWRSFGFKAVLAGLVLGTGAAAVANPLFTLALDALPTIPEWIMGRLIALEEILSHRGPVDVAAQAIGLCVLPGVMEEWVFRHRLAPHLEGHSGWVRGMASGGVFAVIHLDPLSFLPLFAVGVLLFRLYEARGYVAAAAGHIAFNLFGVFVWNRVAWSQPPVDAVACLGVVVAGVVLIGVGERRRGRVPELLSVQG
jgi:hypothetical protein